MRPYEGAFWHYVSVLSLASGNPPVGVGASYDRFADLPGLMAETGRIIDQLVALLGLGCFANVKHFSVGPLHGGGQTIVGR